MKSNYTQPGGSRRYSRFLKAWRGVDFTNDPLNCDPTRLSLAKNIIVDAKGTVHKRAGFKASVYEIQQPNGTPTAVRFPHINGMYVFKPTKQEAMIIVHAGTDMYSRTATGDVFWHITGHDSGRWGYMKDNPSCGFQHKDRFYILDGEHFYNYWFNDTDNQWVLEPVYISATVPETQIAGYYMAEDYTDENDQPAIRYTWVFGEEGEKNLLTTRRMNTFCGDGTNKNFYLDGQNLAVIKVEQYAPSSAAPSAGGDGTFVTNNGSSNVRTKPSMDGGIIGIAPPNTTYTVLGKSGNWYKIQFLPTTTGYIHSSRGTYHDAQGGSTPLSPTDTDWVTLTEGQNNDYTVEEVGASGEQAGTEPTNKVYNCTKIKFKNAPLAHPKGAGLPNIRVTCVPKENGVVTITGADLNSENAYWLMVFRMPLSETVTIKVNGTTLASSNYSTAIFDYHEHKILKITFGTGVVTSTDSIEITYVRESMDKLETIASCNIYGKFGEYNNDRFFYTGNATYRNRDWYTEADDPTCVRENSYNDIGDAATPIAGYLNMQSDMLVIKEESPFDSLFRRTARSGGDDVVFPVKAYSGKGATSRYALCNIKGQCLYWTRDGLYEFISSDLGSKYGTQNRSWLVNDYIKQNEGAAITEARVVPYGDYVIIAFPSGHCYVADTNQQTAPSDSGGYGYEFFYWEGIKINHFVEFNGVFYFDTDVTISETQYSELYEVQHDDYADHYYDGTTVPIDAIIGTFCDQMDEPARYKYIECRGAIIHLQPFTQALDLDIVTDSKAIKYKRALDIERLEMDDPDLEEIDASRPTVPYVAINQRINRFRYVQFIFHNNDPASDGFGILEIEYQYRYGRNVI